MLTSQQKQEIIGIINQSLNRAEDHWKNGGAQLKMENANIFDMVTEARNEVEPSKIPGHALVQEDKTIIDEFIAFVADMRESSHHLLCEISTKTSKASGLERVYYETSALLPAIAKTVKYEEGNVTEYLGDGVLALFKVDPSNRTPAIYAAHRAAKNTISEIRDLVNSELGKRYNLPPLNLGVGLAFSKSLVTLVGLEGEKQPKAIGECIYRATKLSGGKNQVIVDEKLHSIWPTQKGGTLTFRKTQIKKVDGHITSVSN